MPSRTKAVMARPFIKAGISVVFSMGRLGMRIPTARRHIVRKFTVINHSSAEETEESLFSKEMQDTLTKCALIYLHKEVKKGKNIKKNYKVLKMISQGDQEGTSLETLGHTEVELTSLQRPGVPLVLNFGSNS